MENVPDIGLRNAGPGPDPFKLDDVEERYIAVFLQRDYFCSQCRSQVQELAARYEAFQELDCAVVSILPEPIERCEQWVQNYNLPFPVLADPEAETADGFGQTVRFGLLGRFSDLLGRMPKVTVIDTEEGTIVYDHSGSSTFDRPPIEEVLDAVRRHEV